MFLTLCVCCLIACQSFQAKSLSCSQSEFISYPLERNVHDALPSPPLNGELEMTKANLTRTLLPLSFTAVIISCCLFLLAFSLAIKSLPVISSCQPCLPSFMFSALTGTGLSGQLEELMPSLTGKQLSPRAVHSFPWLGPSPSHSINIPFFGPQSCSERDPLIGAR